LYSDNLNSSELVGTWVITKDSLKTLSFFDGCNIYTNISDHVIHLRKDGTCRFSGFISYSTDPTWCLKTEKERYKNIHTQWNLIDSDKDDRRFVNIFDDQKYRYKIDIPRGHSWNEPIYIGEKSGKLKIWFPLHNNCDGTALLSCTPIIFEKTEHQQNIRKKIILPAKSSCL